MGQGSLGERPDALIRVEFRRVGWEMLDVETRLLHPELVQGLTFVGWGVVQEGNHGTV